ncbi:hypothetical protein ED92_10780 [Amycolatopsis sp. MJM2582]|uniref:hypothetical protein n=1 Tax=Amycolatopsis sp. MJM2582 TaxID=1427749 RepID=UPI0005088E90|nr:hypothetical protein [Amycolatopsis sp. MJM2582]KFZ80814.1 hypothetical protein ED92_10780 [Amycolatopsis sp. MJM2582]
MGFSGTACGPQLPTSPSGQAGYARVDGGDLVWAVSEYRWAWFGADGAQIEQGQVRRPAAGAGRGAAPTERARGAGRSC